MPSTARRPCTRRIVSDEGELPCVRPAALIPNLRGRRVGHLLAILLPVLGLCAFGPLHLQLWRQTAPGPSRPLITQAINESALVVLSGNTWPEALALANDRGVVDDSMQLPHLLLQLRRPAAQEQALVALIDQLHDRKSPNYHHWIGASALGAQFVRRPPTSRSLPAGSSSTASRSIRSMRMAW